MLSGVEKYQLYFFKKMEFFIREGIFKGKSISIKDFLESYTLRYFGVDNVDNREKEKS